MANTKRPSKPESATDGDGGPDQSAGAAAPPPSSGRESSAGQAWACRVRAARTGASQPGQSTRKRRTSETSSQSGAKTAKGEEEAPSLVLESSSDEPDAAMVAAALGAEGEEIRAEVVRLRQELEAKTASETACKDKYEELVSKLLEKVECPVCYEIPKDSPVAVCPNGHVVCRSCKREHCPSCRVRMGPGTSLLAVTVIQSIPHTCEFQVTVATFLLLLSMTCFLLSYISLSDVTSTAARLPSSSGDPGARAAPEEMPLQDRLLPQLLLHREDLTSPSG